MRFAKWTPEFRCACHNLVQREKRRVLSAQFIRKCTLRSSPPHILISGGLHKQLCVSTLDTDRKGGYARENRDINSRDILTLKSSVQRWPEVSQSSFIHMCRVACSFVEWRWADAIFIRARIFDSMRQMHCKLCTKLFEFDCIFKLCGIRLI